jgi:dTDP-4-amino-4,6-dideoxygalactose transaminase
MQRRIAAMADTGVIVTASGWAAPKAAIIAAAAATTYGRPVAQEPWRRFREATNIPVVIDAAAAFEAIVDNPSGLTGKVPVVVSFQATKTLSTGEGGAVIWNDDDGLMAGRERSILGFTARARVIRRASRQKSEFHAAVGNASLDAWSETRAACQSTCAAYLNCAEKAGIAAQLILHPSIASCYALFRASSESEAIAVGQVLDKRTAIDLSHEAMERIVAALSEGRRHQKTD